jgi:hypothetical protein
MLCRPFPKLSRIRRCAQRHGPAVGLVALLLAAVIAAGCASQPVVYGGGDIAQADIDACKRLASAAGANSGKTRRAARKTAVGAAMGGAAGGIWGAIRGERDVGNRAAAGAAAGAAVGLIGAAAESTEPSGTFRAYVDRCLRERGYDVVGWN